MSNLKRNATIHSAWSLWRAGLASSLDDAHRLLRKQVAAGKGEVIGTWSGGRKGHPMKIYALFDF